MEGEGGAVGFKVGGDGEERERDGGDGGGGGGDGGCFEEEHFCGYIY